MKTRAFAAVSVFIACLFANQSTAHAVLFWKNKEKTASPAVSNKSAKPNKDIRVTETSDFIILFFFTGGHEKREDGMGESRKYLEISYKFSIRAEDPLRYFGGEQGWMKVRFLDSEGFSLAEDKVSYKDLLRGKEHYGFAWIEERKAGVLRKADLQPLKQDEIPKPLSVIKPLEEPVKKAAPKTVIPKLESKKESTSAPSEAKPAAEGTSPVTEAVQQEKPAPQENVPQTETPEAEPEVGLVRGGATNAEVTAVLSELDKRAPTAIPESRSSPSDADDKEG